MDRLEEIRQRTEAATPGPWDSKTNRHPECNGEPWGWISGASGNITWSGSAGKANADFIAHSREDIPYLLSEADRLNALHKREIIITGEYAQRVIDVTARAAAAEAERDACKADFEAYMRGSMECCAYCIHDDECEPGESLCYANVCGFEWRGPEAGKGDALNE